MSLSSEGELMDRLTVGPQCRLPPEREHMTETMRGTLTEWRRLWRIQNPGVLLLCVVLLAIVGAADRATGYELSFSIFYLFPIAICIASTIAAIHAPIIGSPPK